MTKEESVLNFDNQNFLDVKIASNYTSFWRNLSLKLEQHPKSLGEPPYFHGSLVKDKSLTGFKPVIVSLLQLNATRLPQIVS